MRYLALLVTPEGGVGPLRVGERMTHVTAEYSPDMWRMTDEQIIERIMRPMLLMLRRQRSDEAPQPAAGA